MYGLKDEFVAYCFDVAVTRWGNAFEAAVNASTKGAKTAGEADRAADRTVRKWLNIKLGPPVGVGKQIRG